MEIMICRDEEQFGPYPRNEAIGHLKSGTLRFDDLAWHEGMADWRPLADVLGLLDTLTAPVVPPPVLVGASKVQSGAPQVSAGRSKPSTSSAPARTRVAVARPSARIAAEPVSQRINFLTPQTVGIAACLLVIGAIWYFMKQEPAAAPANNSQVAVTATPVPGSFYSEPDQSEIIQKVSSQPPMNEATPTPTPVAFTEPPPTPQPAIPTATPRPVAALSTPVRVTATPVMVAQLPPPMPQAPVQPAGDPNRHSISLDVTNVTTGIGSTNTSNGYYSSTTNIVKEQKIRMRVTNMKHESDTVKVEWFFFGKPVNGNKRYCYDKGEKEVAIMGGRWEELVETSKELSSTTYTYDYGPRSAQGDKPDGWIVRAIAGDKILAQKASSPTLDQLGKDKEAFEKLVKPATPAPRRGRP